jgi:hypothetical protein
MGQTLSISAYLKVQTAQQKLRYFFKKGNGHLASLLDLTIDLIGSLHSLYDQLSCKEQDHQHSGIAIETFAQSNIGATHEKRWTYMYMKKCMKKRIPRKNLAKNTMPLPGEKKQCKYLKRGTCWYHHKSVSQNTLLSTSLSPFLRYSMEQSHMSRKNVAFTARS